MHPDEGDPSGDLIAVVAAFIWVTPIVVLTYVAGVRTTKRLARRHAASRED